MLFFSYFKDLVGREVTVELKKDLAIKGTLHSQVFSIGPIFKGVKMIPPRTHFVYYSSSNRDNSEFSPMVGFFIHTCPSEVYNFVRLAELYYVGSHDMDIKGSTKSSRNKKRNQPVLFQPTSEFLTMIDEVYKTLVEKTKFIEGSNVENNRLCVSVHFRCVEEKDWTPLAEEVKSVLKDYPKLRLSQGRKVLEIRPTIKWDKGKALEFLLESLEGKKPLVAIIDGLAFGGGLELAMVGYFNKFNPLATLLGFRGQNWGCVKSVRLGLASYLHTSVQFCY